MIKYTDKEFRYVLPVSKWKEIYKYEYSKNKSYEGFEEWSKNNLSEYPPKWSLNKSDKRILGNR